MLTTRYVTYIIPRSFIVINLLHQHPDCFSVNNNIIRLLFHRDRWRSRGIIDEHHLHALFESTFLPTQQKSRLFLQISHSQSREGNLNWLETSTNTTICCLTNDLTDVAVLWWVQAVVFRHCIPRDQPKYQPQLSLYGIWQPNFKSVLVIRYQITIKKILSSVLRKSATGCCQTAQTRLSLVSSSKRHECSVSSTIVSVNNTLVVRIESGLLSSRLWLFIFPSWVTLSGNQVRTSRGEGSDGGVNVTVWKQLYRKTSTLVNMHAGILTSISWNSMLVNHGVANIHHRTKSPWHMRRVP